MPCKYAMVKRHTCAGPSSSSSASSSRDLQQHLFLMLQGCKKSTPQLTQLHAQLVVNGFFRKNFLVTKLLSICISCGNFAHAARAFDQVEERSATLCNQMIRAAAISAGDQNATETSIRIYNEMRRGVISGEQRPNGFTYAFLLLNAACSAKAAGAHVSRVLGEQLHARVLADGFSSSVYVQTNLINVYGAVASAGSARILFDEMPQRSIVSWNSMLAAYLRAGDVRSASAFFHEFPGKDKVSWTSMIAGCARAGEFRQALAVYRAMRTANIEADHVTALAVLTACADSGNLELGRCVHARMFGILSRQEGDRGHVVTLSNALIHMYVRCGAVDDSFQVFQEMYRRNTASWTSMIAGFAAHGRSDDALNLFETMQLQEAEDENQRPDWLTYLAVLRACSYAGRIGDANRYFGRMRAVHGIRPRIQHYGCMIDALSRAGHLSVARDLIETMPLHANDAVWGALLWGCYAHGDAKLAERLVIHRVLELIEPEKASGYLVLVSSVYASVKQWSDVCDVKQNMLGGGIGKAAGRSSVHV